MVTYKDKADEKNRSMGSVGKNTLPQSVSEKSTPFGTRTVRNRGKRGGP